MIQRLGFGQWAPDVAPSGTNNLAVARNVYAAANGYRPIRAPILAAGGMLPAKCTGAGSFVAPQGQATIVAGTDTGLYRAQLAGWQQIGAGYAGTATSRWRFAQFGGLAIATNGIDPMVKIDLALGTTAALGGSPPRFDNLAVVKDFLVGAVLDGDVQTLGWSGINNAENWTFGQEQSDYQTMPTGGSINGIFGGEYGLILQRGRITRMTYVGDNVVFQFDEISSNVGCVSKNTTAQWGTLGFFLSDTGFMMWDGATVRPIGQERIDRYFKAFYGAVSFENMSTAIDPANSIVAWSMGDRVLLYNWALDRWTESDLAVTIVFPGFSRDVSLEELGPALDAPPFVLDDPAYRGGDPRFYLVDMSNRLAALSGTTMAAEIRLTEQELIQGRETRLRYVRPISDVESGLTTTVQTKVRQGSASSSNSYTGLTTSGDVPIRERGRYVRMGLNLEQGAPWTFIQGIEVGAEAGARR